MTSLIVEESVKLQLMVYFAEDDVALVFGIRTVSVNTFIGSDAEIVDLFCLLLLIEPFHVCCIVCYWVVHLLFKNIQVTEAFDSLRP